MAKLVPSSNCYTLIKHFEGCELEAYLCPAGIPTIGYGSTFYADGKPVKMGDKITIQQAEALLPNIVNKFSISVNEALKVDVKQHQFDAMLSLCYNIGIGNFRKSTLLGLVNKKADSTQIVAEFAKWNKVKGVVSNGLTNRRKAEATLYSKGVVIL